MPQIDVRKLADEASFSSFHALVLFWCALIVVFDGYDLAVAGIALPSIMKGMAVDATSAGLIVSSALFGMVSGAIFLGMIADRIGRRRTIVICISLFSICTSMAGFTSDPVTFSMNRFLAGLGIGGAMPIVVAHMTEYSPQRIRNMMVTLMFSGYALGGMLAAALGKSLIERYGWQSVFIAAGLPVLLIPIVPKWLPESMPFLIKSGQIDALKGVVSRLQPSYRPQPDDQFALRTEDKAGDAPIGKLFQEGRGVSTVMFWVVFFMCLFMVYALSSWLAKMMTSAGYSLGSALTFVLVMNFGAMIGAIGGGWLADRFNIKYVLMAFFLVAALSITLLGYKVPKEILFLVVGVAGATTLGTQLLAYSYVGQFYPMGIRSTGIGWASGVGRSGAILAPIVIGMLIGMHLPLQQNFIVIAIPAVIAFVAIALVDHSRSASAHHRDVSVDVPEPTPAGAGSTM